MFTIIEFSSYLIGMVATSLSQVSIPNPFINIFDCEFTTLDMNIDSNIVHNLKFIAWRDEYWSYALKIYLYSIGVIGMTFFWLLDKILF